MRLLFILLVASTSIFAQQATPIKMAKTAGVQSCKTAISIPQCVAIMICQSTGRSDEAFKIAEQAGMEVSFTKSKDGRFISYLIKNPSNGQRAIATIPSAKN